MGLKSASPDNLPIAIEVAEKVICLPIYPDLENNEIEKIVLALWTKACGFFS